MESSRRNVDWAKARFAEVVQGGGEVPLDEMAFLISATLLGSDSSEIVEQMTRLDELAAAVPSPTFAGIAQFLFTGSEAFIGNRAEYYDPDNSLLPRVLDRHAGIPISLSVIMMGHFLVGLAPAHGDIPETFADPFHEGRIMDADQCQELFHQVVGVHQTFLAGFLAPVHPMAIVERMLNNLKAVYQSRSEHDRLHRIMALRSYFPGLGKSEREEFLRLMAPFN
jgi:regulator of sirC expression with transglutaminase-like and TPR domain